MRNATILACVLLLAACTTVPQGPRVMVLPGAGKSFDQFQTDDAVCRQWASQQAGTTAQAVSGQIPLRAVPAARRSPYIAPPPPPPPPAAALPPGVAPPSGAAVPPPGTPPPPLR